MLRKVVITLFVLCLSQGGFAGENFSFDLLIPDSPESPDSFDKWEASQVMLVGSDREVDPQETQFVSNPFYIKWEYESIFSERMSGEARFTLNCSVQDRKLVKCAVSTKDGYYELLSEEKVAEMNNHLQYNLVWGYRRHISETEFWDWEGYDSSFYCVNRASKYGKIINFWMKNCQPIFGAKTTVGLGYFELSKEHTESLLATVDNIFEGIGMKLTYQRSFTKEKTCAGYSQETGECVKWELTVKKNLENGYKAFKATDEYGLSLKLSMENNNYKAEDYAEKLKFSQALTDDIKEF